MPQLVGAATARAVLVPSRSHAAAAGARASETAAAHGRTGAESVSVRLVSSSALNLLTKFK